MPQQLLQKEDEIIPSEEDGPAVVIPDHLQVHTRDCQHLSFGSFIGANLSTSYRSPRTNSTEASSVADTAPISQADARFVCHWKAMSHISLSTSVSTLFFFLIF